MSLYLYVPLCLLLPMLWGWLVVIVTDRLQATRQAKLPEDAPSRDIAPEYHI